MPRLFTLLAFVLSSSVGFSSLEAATRKLSIRAVLHDPLKPQAELYVPLKEGALERLNLALEGLTEPQEVALTDGTLQLFSSLTIDPQKPLENLAATVKVADSLTRAIVIIIPSDKESPTPYRMVVLNDDPSAFPKGETRVLNMAALPLAMKAGEHAVKLPTAKISTLPVVKKLDDMNRAPTEFYRPGDAANEWVLFAERPMQFSLNARNLIVIYQMAGLKEPRMRTLVDTTLR
jgi:hypothetical protein